jgi:beta-lactamase regulating signal transducer with metallopeptidase domain
MNELFNQIANDVIFASAWTLIHSVWQFAIIAFCYLCFSRFTTRSAPRYQFALGLFSLCALVSAATFFHYYTSVSDAHQLLATTSGMLAQQQPQDTLDSAIDFFNGNLHLIIYVWLGGFFFHLCRTTLDYIQCKKLVQFHSQSLDEKWIAKFSKLEQLIGTTTKVVYKTSTLVSSPCVIGVFKPVILVPPSVLLNLSPAYIEAILLHELAHIKRNDYLVNLLQCMVNGIFFFNPFLRYLSNKIDQERENACDDLAVSHCNSPLTYATSLGKLTELGLANQLALAANANKYSVLNRVKRLLGDFPTEKTTFQFFSSTLIGAFGLVMAANIQALPSPTANINNLKQELEMVKAPEPVSIPEPAKPTVSATTKELTPTQKPAAISAPAPEIQPVQKPTPVAPTLSKTDFATKAATAYVKQPLTAKKNEITADIDAEQSIPKADEAYISTADRNPGNNETRSNKKETFINWEKSGFVKFFVNQTVDFSKYNQIIVFPTTFDRLKIAEKAKKNAAESWMKSSFKQMDEYCNYFDHAAKYKFKKSSAFKLTNKGGDNVLAMEIRMMEILPISASKKEPNVGVLKLQAVLVDSKNGELVAVIEDIVPVNGNYVTSHISYGGGSGAAMLPGETSPFAVANGSSGGYAARGWVGASLGFTNKLHEKMKKLKRMSL